MWITELLLRRGGLILSEIKGKSRSKKKPPVRRLEEGRKRRVRTSIFLRRLSCSIPG